jgi:hypothetical protein
MTEQNQQPSGFNWEQEAREMEARIAQRRAGIDPVEQSETSFGRNELEWLDRTIRLRRAGYTSEQAREIREIVEAPVDMATETSQPQDPTL